MLEAWDGRTFGDEDRILEKNKSTRDTPYKSANDFLSSVLQARRRVYSPADNYNLEIEQQEI